MMAFDSESNITSHETYAYGIERLLLSNPNIAIIRTSGDMSRDAINTWASLVILTMQEWDASCPLLILNDLSHPAQGINAYARQRASDLMNYHPDGLMIYSALLFSKTFVSRIFEHLIRAPQFQRSQHHVRIFHTQDDALAWLHAQAD